MNTLSRREFLVGSMLTGAFAGLTEGQTGGAVTVQTDWFDRPMRWAQLTLVETILNITIRNSGWTISNACTPMLPASARAASLRTIRREFLYTIEASG